MEVRIEEKSLCISLSKEEKEQYNFFFDLARAFASYLFHIYGRRDLSIALGQYSYDRDDEIEQALCQGFFYDGCDVLEMGEAIAPAMFMATVLEEFSCDGAIYLHTCNKDQEAILTFYTSAGALDEEELSKILKAKKAEKWNEGQGGSITKGDLMKVYSMYVQNRLSRELKEDSSLHIVVDALNGNGSYLVEEVLKPLGINTQGSRNLEKNEEYQKIDLDLHFADLFHLIQKENADLGVLISPDGSSLLVIDEEGNIITDRTALMNRKKTENSKTDAFLKQAIVGSLLDLIADLDAPDKKPVSLKAYREQIFEDLVNFYAMKDQIDVKRFGDDGLSIGSGKQQLQLFFPQIEDILKVSYQGNLLSNHKQELIDFLSEYPSLDLNELK